MAIKKNTVRSNKYFILLVFLGMMMGVESNFLSDRNDENHGCSIIPHYFPRLRIPGTDKSILYWCSLGQVVSGC